MSGKNYDTDRLLATCNYLHKNWVETWNACIEVAHQRQMDQDMIVHFIEELKQSILYSAKLEEQNKLLKERLDAQETELRILRSAPPAPMEQDEPSLVVERQSPIVAFNDNDCAAWISQLEKD